MGKGSRFRKWDEVAPDVLALIFTKLSLFELLIVVPSVCKSWQQVIMGPYCWQEIDIVKWCRECRDRSKVDRMLKLLIPRTCGTLRELSVSGASDNLINFIASHAPSLQTLNLVFGETIVFREIEKRAHLLGTNTSSAMRCPLKLRVPSVYAIRRHCESLTSLRLSMSYGQFMSIDGKVIASTFPHLKNLMIHNTRVDISTTIKILENCKHLELLEIRNNRVKLGEEIFKGIPKLKVMVDCIISDQDENPDEEDYYNYECTCDYPGSP